MTTVPTPNAIYCECCGKIIGAKTGDGILIRHKGRQIKIVPDKRDSCTVCIICDKETCKFSNEIRV